ncbi:GAF domain-containing hybrid sensor histidine kinase/response regulator [Trichocoleus sp. FACHB-262]|uniref:hybrid sensor histidine kinase/response regulator n=1 Tax=Trichocoleus sp. FACHB-262 TaxID=2692869 RepID=UPI001687E019|nr:GAF domain-containing hybrid sensor histidine kinase/response regulator [Trichocoleus sp. FACHB-262]MBD2124529.1 GAF domain-containing protein [Trichocoleus sp. FACHB-262]
MPSFPASAVCRTLPGATFNQIRDLLHQTALAIAPQATATVLTEAVLSATNRSLGLEVEQFVVVVSEPFSALLSAKSVGLESGLEPGLHPGLHSGPELHYESSTESAACEVNLTFEPAAIAEFLFQLRPLFSHQSDVPDTLGQLCQQLCPNDAKLQSEFTLQLVERLAIAGTANPGLNNDYPSVSVCQPVEEALRQQVEQERLLNQVITQVRQSLELSSILETAVQQVRHFLQADRLVIYQFDAHLAAVRPNPQTPFDSEPLQHLQPGYGCITYEARAAAEISSVLHVAEEENCFVGIPNCQEKYCQGYTLAVSDVEATYIISPCLLKLLRRHQIQAKLVAPIVVQGELWGLLIAHQCFAPREWQESEKTFLQRIAEHLAIAIDQAQLYAQVQQQKETLEERVIERTQELHDALAVAQAASQVRNEFVATMSHELRTPLTCVIGMSATLLRWSFGHLSDRQRHYLQTIHDSGEHLLALINDILDLSQVEAGKATLNLSEFSLTNLVNQSLQTLQEKAESNHIALISEVRIPAAGDRFTADQRRLKQVLLNLLSNAIKFTPEGGQVTLRAWLEAETAVLQVEDTGIGIPEHQRPLLFQKFQQLDTSYQRKYEGTGLGLALTKQLVELHGGWIDVDSTVGMGSVFTVHLPAQQPSAATDVPTTHSSQGNLQGRIVLIENHEESAMLICDLLTAAGYQVVWLVDGSTAVKQIEILHPVVVVADMQLPGMDGYEVMHYLRTSPATQALKILVLTNHCPDKTDSHYLEAGADDCLKKPIEPEQLLYKVAALMESITPAALEAAFSP